MKNTATQSTPYLRKEQERLKKLIIKLKGNRAMRSERARASRTLECVEAELERRNG